MHIIRADAWQDLVTGYGTDLAALLLHELL